MPNWNFTPQPFSQLQNVQQQNNVFAVPIQNEESVGMYPVAMGNTVILYNPTFTKIWLKSTDFNGFPQPIRIFDVIEVKQQDKKSDLTEQFATKEELEKLQSNFSDKFTILINKIDFLTNGGFVNDVSTNNTVVAKSANVSTEV